MAGLNGASNDRPAKRTVIEHAAESVFITGLNRILVIGVTLVGIPIGLGVGAWAVNWASAQSDINHQQNIALEKINSSQRLLEYRLGKAEETNAEQEIHFEFSDRRLNKLERALPPGSWREYKD